MPSPHTATYLDGSIKDTWQLRGIVGARKTLSLLACLTRHPLSSLDRLREGESPAGLLNE